MESEKILLNVGIDEGEIGKAIKAMQDARKRIDELKAANKELEKQGLKNSETYILQENEIKNLNRTVSDNSKILQANTSMVQANEGSIEALRKANSALMKERNTLNTNTEEGRKRIQAINQELDKNNEAIRENSSQLEKQKINIGNYSSALDNLVPGLGGMATNLQATTEASGGFGKGLMSMVRASLAFIATPLGAILTAIVAALGLLVTYIKNTTGGMDKFEQVSAAVGAVMNVLVDRVVSLAKAFGSLLILDFAGFAENSEKAFAGLGDELVREANAAYELQAAIQELEDAEINYEIAASKNENTIKRLILQSKNRTLTEQERIKLLDEAMKVEGRQTEELLKNREEALRIANEEASKRVDLARISGETEAEYAQRLIDTGLVLDDYRDKIKDALIARNNAEGSSLAFQEKIQNQRDALAEKAEAERQKRDDKAAADRAKKEEEIRKNAENEMQAIRDLTIYSIEQDIKRTTSIEERVEKEKALETVKRDYLLAEDGLTAAQRALIQAQYQDAITEIENKGISDRKAAFDADNAARSAEFDRMIEELAQNAQEEVQIEVNKEKEKLLNGQISQEEYDRSMLEAQLAALSAQQAINKQFGDEDLRLAGQITDAKIALKQYEKDTSVMLEQQKFDAVQSIFAQGASLFNKNTIAYKVMASAQAAMDTYKAATSAYSAMAGIPIVGPALGAVAAGLAIASGLANIAKINSVKIPKLAQGDMITRIEGKDHSQGGEILSIGGKAVAEVQGDEHVAVLKRGATDKLRLLSQANKLAGGKDFFMDRRPVRYAADGGLVASNVTQKANATLDMNKMTQAMTIAMQSMPAPIVKVTDIERVNNNRAKATMISELS